MAKTSSKMVPLGTTAPDFTLPDTVSGKPVSLSAVKSSKGNLIMFLCNHCPFVKHVQKELARLGKEYQAKGITVIAISSNDVENYPQDGPELMKAEAQTAGYTFPYLYDESQQVAKDYDAACTPDFYLFDGELKLVYRGQLDGSRPGSGEPVTGRDLRSALEAVLAGRQTATEQYPSIGCNIKWKN